MTLNGDLTIYRPKYNGLKPVCNHTHSENQVYAKPLADRFQVAQQVLCKLYHVERLLLWHHHHPVSQPLFISYPKKKRSQMHQPSKITAYYQSSCRITSKVAQSQYKQQIYKDWYTNTFRRKENIKMQVAKSCRKCLNFQLLQLLTYSIEKPT